MLSASLTLSDLPKSWVNFAVVSIASAQVSLLVTYVKMPLIIGYMAFGLLFGPQICGLVTTEDLPNLQYITQFALAFICLSAGAELYLPELKLLFRRILVITGLITAITFVIVCLVVFAESQGGLTQYTAALPEGISQNGCQFSIAMIAAAIMISQSPASAIAVVREVRAKGPFTSTMLGVTVLIDVVVLLLASIATSIANSECDPASSGFSVIDLVLTIATVISAVFIGWVVGKIIIFLIWLPRVPGEWVVPWLGFGVFQFSTWFLEYTTDVWGHGVNLDALLICIAAGYVVANQSRNRRKFLRFFNKAGPIIFIPFFTLTGAGLKLNVLAQSVGFAVITALARAVSFAAACMLGGWWTGMEAKQRNTLWIAMITQAGVSLGIAAEVALGFPSWGSAFQSVIIAVILINQVLGPVLCAKVLDYNDETNKAEADNEDDDIIKRCVLIGMTDESFALAQRLLRANWDVVFLDTDEQRLSMTQSLVVPVRRKHSHGGEEEEVPHVDVSKVEALSTVREGSTSTAGTEVVEEQKSSSGEVELAPVDESETTNFTADGEGQDRHPESSESYIEVDTAGERVITRLVKPVALTKLKNDTFALTESGSSRAKDAKQKALIAGYEEALNELNLSAKTIDAAVLCLASDAQSFSLANLLLDTMHVRKVISQVNNPNWATMFASIGVLTVYSFSSTVAMLFQCVVAANNKFPMVNERKPLHTQLADHIIHPDTTPTVPIHLTYSEDSDQADYLRTHPNPPIRPEQLFKFNERVKVVSEAERGRYVESIWGVHEARSGIDLTDNMARAGLTFSGPMMAGEGDDDEERRDESEARAAMNELDNVDWKEEEKKEMERGARGHYDDDEED